jgi:protein-tyrosine phosphatase
VGVLGAAGLSREVHLPVVPNARHLGGLPSATGATSLSDVVRSATLAELQPSGVDTLRTQGVRIVIDLRTADERELAPEPDLSAFGFTNAWVPMVERDPAPFGVSLEYGHAGFLWMYQNFLEYGRNAMCHVVQTLADSQGGVLYHCSAGEDRTGVVTALLLSLVGVSDQTVVADHSLSLTREILAARGRTGEAATQRMAAPLQAMRAWLEMIRERWGSVEGYLLDAGASPSAIAEVRARARN